MYFEVNFDDPRSLKYVFKNEYQKTAETVH